jgi:PAS domain S-box-containing protein
MPRRAHGSTTIASPTRQPSAPAIAGEAECFALIAEHSKDLLALLDATGRFVYANPAHQLVLGYQPTELIGTPAAALVHPDDRHCYEAQLSTGEPHLSTYRQRHANGSWRWVQARVSRVQRDGANLFVSVGRDATDHRQAEQALRDERQRLQLALDAARIGVWEWDIPTGALAWSPHLEVMHGFAPGTFGGTFEEFIGRVHPNERAQAIAAIERAVRDGGPFSTEFRIVWPDGSIHWVAGEGQAFHDAGGRPERMIGIGIDVTERKQAQDALRQSEERYRAFIDQSSEGIWRIELDAPIDAGLGEDDQIELFYQRAYLAECNDAMARMYGLERADELAGARLGDLLVRSDPSNEEYLRAFIRSGYRLNDAESHEVDRHGDARYFLNNLVGIIEDGWLLRAWGSQRDITERKQIEDDRARLFQQAQEAIRLRDIFFSVAAHELKTPLTSLLGQAQLIQRRGTRECTLNERDGRTIAIVVDQAARLNKMVTALLDISRLEQGKLSIERAPLDLGQMLGRVVDEIRPALAEHVIEYIPPDAPLPLDGDELRLEQVVQNLLQNAIKYSPAGGPIVVRAERRADVACIAISDHGIGIPEEALPQLFQRFYRADNVDDRQFAGLGIGLYVVREIVELHGGTVSATSVEGQGSTFTVCLPLTEETEDKGQSTNATSL